MKKRKVAILLHGLGANGIDTLFANLAEQWDKDKFEITYLIAVDKDAPQFWDERVAAAGIKVVKLHDLDKGRLKQYPKTLYKAFKEYGPFDTVHVNMDMLSGICLLIAMFAGIKTRVVHAHRGSSDMPKPVVKRLLKNVYLFTMKWLMRTFSTARIGCSDVAGDYFFGKNNYQLVYNGINIDNYYVDRSASESEHRFVAVGRLFPPKNPLKIVEVFAEIRKRVPDATLTWVGDGQMRGDVESYIEKLGLGRAIKLIGVRNDVNKFLKESDYYLLTSFYEGLSLSLAEAQAAGLVCFISDTCSKLSDCGLCMYIPLEASSEMWAEIICKYIERRDVQYRLDIKKLKQFDIKTTALSLQGLY